MGDRLKGRAAIVVGAGSVPGEGIGNGKAAAVVYAREGASVVLVDVNPEAAQETRRMIEKEGGRSLVFEGNVAQAKSCQAMADACIQAYGRIDILHNNVALGQKTLGGPLDVSLEEWDRMLEVNLKGMFLTSRAVLPQMLKQGSGAILNISSVAAERSGYRQFIYSVTKAGVNSLTRCLAVEYADKGIRVNCIMPGLIDTPRIIRFKSLYGGDEVELKKVRAQSCPMKKMGDGWDIANASLFLVSDEAKYITGQVLAVDGGYLCKG